LLYRTDAQRERLDDDGKKQKEDGPAAKQPAKR
jgi:hypothetical protein